MEKEKANKNVRAVLNRCGIRQWQLADLLGISEQTLCKTLRHELPESKQAEMTRLIEEYAAERGE